jgi:hypothetical protein
VLLAMKSMIFQRVAFGGHNIVLFDSYGRRPCQISGSMLSPSRLQISERSLTFRLGTDEVQSVQVFPHVLLEGKKECFHQCMFVLSENLGHASHF